MFLFSFIIGMPASWSGNGRIGLYADKVKGLRGGRDIGYF
jgi:hypothetical protein